MADDTVTQYPWKTLEPTNTWQQRIMLFYGQSGTGKTYLAGQFPKPLFLSCDPGTLGGALSVASMGVKHIKISSYDQLIQLLPMLKKAALEGEFETLVVDSMSYLAQVIMRSILALKAKEIPTFDDWNLNATRMRMLINNFADLHAHIIFVAVDDISKDEVTGKMYGGPNLPGKLQKELPQACDLTLRLFTTSSYSQVNGQMKLVTRYRFRSVPDDVWFAKDRTNTLPPEGDCDFEAFKHLFNFTPSEGETK